MPASSVLLVYPIFSHSFSEIAFPVKTIPWKRKKMLLHSMNETANDR
ncbi:hypothetical protein D922_01685 [Enterococcus faecalis 06-MB-DW-09]|nr:hypothetical protein D931_01168 [Enterococcus faecium 13.SD.W.09]EPH93883.1 hypothetical protein D922_01685 [Enterococcus faecalis 06-MB-DW-09]